MEDGLTGVASALEAEGYDAHELYELEDEIEALDRPPGLFRRLTDAARERAATQWRNLVGELRESREAMALIRLALRNEPLSAEQRDKVRAQLFDLVKIFPAGLIAAANAVAPIPGTSVLTPWILVRMNLMPSHWREAHVLAQLRRKQRRLQAGGNERLAAKLGAVADRIEAEAERRQEIANAAVVLTHWDRNGNGRWDHDEVDGYLAELARVRDMTERLAARKAWFVLVEGEIFGAHRWTELQEVEADGALVCFDGKTGWVALAHLLGEPPRFDLDPPRG